MKKLYIVVFSFLPCMLLSQVDRRVQFGIHGLADIPIHSQMPRMSTNYGGGMFLSVKPHRRVPLFLELRGSIGQYSSKTSTETFIFNDGSTTVTDVTFRSLMNKVQFGTKIYFTSSYQRVKPYVMPLIGYNFMRSRIRIADPMDEDDCKPLVDRISHGTSGLTYGLETGVELDLVGTIKGDESQGRLYVSVSYLSSARKTDYINIKYMSDHEHGVHEGGHGETSQADGRPLTTDFVNVSSNDLHSHKIAEIYNTYLRFINVNIGYVWYF
ncbi:MAG: hypothetical protein KF704_05080 [Crocinitomicaceae bacterium]|nr:hypothetical protein [Crocinitomicaceae bacterium]